MKKFCIFLSVICILVSAGIVSAEDQVKVCASSNLTDSLTEVINDYQTDNKDVSITPLFGSASKLAKKIKGNSDCDIFISSNKSQMNKVKKMIDSKSESIFLQNKLLLIASADYSGKIQKDSSLEDVIKTGQFDKLEIGDLNSVPSGNYAKALLEDMKLWKGLKSKVVYSKSTKDIVDDVENGKVPLAFVFNTDVTELKTAKIALDTKKAVAYPVAVLRKSVNKASVIDFYNYLLSEDSGKIFEKDGFTYLSDNASKAMKSFSEEMSASADKTEKKIIEPTKEISKNKEKPAKKITQESSEKSTTEPTEVVTEELTEEATESSDETDSEEDFDLSDLTSTSGN